MSRSASSISTTCQRPPVGALGRPQHQRAHLADRDGQALGHDRADVGVGAGQRGVALAADAAAALAAHCSAAAKARAATDRPEPGGPVKSQAWVIAPAGAASPRTIAAAAAHGGRDSTATALVLADQVGEDRRGHQAGPSRTPDTSR